MTNGSLAKEFGRLLKNIDSVTDGQAEVSNWDDADLTKFELQIKPNAGHYRGGTFVFEVQLDENDYFSDETPPMVICKTDIYHPNIDTTMKSDDETNVCLNILDHGTWTCAFGLEGCVVGLVYLFHHPNLDDPLSPLISAGMDDGSFAENVKMYMAGEPVEDVTFEKDFVVKPTDFIPEKNVGEIGQTAGEIIYQGEVTNGEVVVGEIIDASQTTGETIHQGEVKNEEAVTIDGTEKVTEESAVDSNATTDRTCANETKEKVQTEGAVYVQYTKHDVVDTNSIDSLCDNFQDILSVYVFGV